MHSCRWIRRCDGAGNCRIKHDRVFCRVHELFALPRLAFARPCCVRTCGRPFPFASPWYPPPSTPLLRFARSSGLRAGYRPALARANGEASEKSARSIEEGHEGQEGPHRKGVPIGWLSVSGCPAASSLTISEASLSRSSPRSVLEHSEFDGILSLRLKRPLETAAPDRPMVWPLAMMEETDARRRLSSCAPPNFNLNAEDADTEKFVLNVVVEVIRCACVMFN